MRKKILGASFVVAIMTVAGYNVYMSQTRNSMSDLVLANVEALANNGPETNGNTVDCYSSSDPKKGASYYDCGPCEKVHNSKGVDTKRECIYRG